MKWHRMRPQSRQLHAEPLERLELRQVLRPLEAPDGGHVEEVLALFDEIFHGFVAVGVYMLFFTANQIFSEMASYG